VALTSIREDQEDRERENIAHQLRKFIIFTPRLLVRFEI